MLFSGAVVVGPVVVVDLTGHKGFVEPGKHVIGVVDL